ncbi:MAG: hypothetical protein M3362_02230 [Acidobacteriota bacterium]|nr:hypothetical protein [Acidobacteriota bacterium]
MKSMWKRVVVSVMTLAALALALPFSALARGGNQVAGLAVSKQARSASGTRSATNGISKANVDSFNTGFALVRAMYLAGLAQEDEESAPDAIVEIVYLADQFEGQPEAGQLQKLLKMVVRNTGTREERWGIVQDVINTHRKRIEGEALWYFNAGVVVPEISLNAYMKDSAGLKSSFGSLQKLIADAPKGVPASVLTPMQQLAKYATQTTYSKDDLAAISSTTGTVMDTFNS